MSGDVERLRRHRIEFEYAVAHGLSLPEARLRLAGERRRARVRAIVAAQRPGPTSSSAPPPASMAEPNFWWRRD